MATWAMQLPELVDEGLKLGVPAFRLSGFNLGEIYINTLKYVKLRKKKVLTRMHFL